MTKLRTDGVYIQFLNDGSRDPKNTQFGFNFMRVMNDKRCYTFGGQLKSLFNYEKQDDYDERFFYYSYDFDPDDIEKYDLTSENITQFKPVEGQKYIDKFNPSIRLRYDNFSIEYIVPNFKKFLGIDNISDPLEAAKIIYELKEDKLSVLNGGYNGPWLLEYPESNIEKFSKKHICNLYSLRVNDNVTIHFKENPEVIFGIEHFLHLPETEAPYVFYPINSDSSSNAWKDYYDRYIKKTTILDDIYAKT